MIPRIEATPIFSGSPPAESRKHDYVALGCNETYYDVNYNAETREKCKDLLNTVSIYVFGGAARKFKKFQSIKMLY